MGRTKTPGKAGLRSPFLPQALHPFLSIPTPVPVLEAKHNLVTPMPTAAGTSSPRPGSGGVCLWKPRDLSPP